MTKVYGQKHNCGKITYINIHTYIYAQRNVYYFVGCINIPTAASNLPCDCFISASAPSEAILLSNGSKGKACFSASS